MTEQQQRKLFERIQAALSGGDQKRAHALIERIPGEDGALSSETRAWRDTVLHLAGLLAQGLAVRPGDRVPYRWNSFGERSYLTATGELLSAARAVAGQWAAREEREARFGQRQPGRTPKRKKARTAVKATLA